MTKKAPNLAEYRRKRDRTRTDEPRGTARKKAQALAYVIQKHAASRLHYDLPSLNAFEGTIPKGEDGGGAAMIWDRGTYTSGGDDADDPVEGLRQGCATGDFKFVLKGKRLKGSWVLLRTRRGNPPGRAPRIRRAARG